MVNVPIDPMSYVGDGELNTESRRQRRENYTSVAAARGTGAHDRPNRTDNEDMCTSPSPERALISLHGENKNTNMPPAVLLVVGVS